MKDRLIEFTECDLPEITPIEETVMLEFHAFVRMTINTKTMEGGKIELDPDDPEIRKRLKELGEKQNGR